MPLYYFDTSALVKHYHMEAGTDAVDRLIAEPGARLAIVRLTLVETVSVFALKVRTGEFDAAEFTRLRALFGRMWHAAGIRSSGCSTSTTIGRGI